MLPLRLFSRLCFLLGLATIRVEAGSWPALELTVDNWAEKTAHVYLFIKCYRKECPNCGAIKRTWEKLQQEYNMEGLLIANVDCNHPSSAKLCKRLGVEQTPAFYYGTQKSLKQIDKQMRYDNNQIAYIIMESYVKKLLKLMQAEPASEPEPLSELPPKKAAALAAARKAMAAKAARGEADEASGTEETAPPAREAADWSNLNDLYREL
eukprot:gnl/TRDRNA2_/TRDRNA2_51631_c0_seq1.p1 gnl/TRDRNA2_/TRDRNA2_51631_c0~~gnl/TRDRNA2_/TRDRNA2_51631_c0_seq1.p1  ORF type:complete len:209 (+),score=52.28 gnl/TRDRNA2_/TRDRNA2_51631_c0_seq1:72-698(+)